MSSYLRFYELERSPFDGGGRTQVVLGTRAVRDAFGTIRAGIEAGDSRICVSGEAGLGKTSLARALPKLLGEQARVAVVPDPTIGWETARPAIARQWGVQDGGLARPALLAIRKDRPLVLVIDQAECADDDFLDHLDVLLCYRTPDDRPVVQSVLMARLSNGEGEAAATPLHWWLDRIHTLQLEFAPLPLDGVAPYIEKHLRRAGWRGAPLFDAAAAAAIHGHTGGVPGAISDLCERLLIEAAGRSLDAIDAPFVEAFCTPASSGMDRVDETAADDAMAATDACDDASEMAATDACDDASEMAATDAFDDASEMAVQAAMAELDRIGLDVATPAEEAAGTDRGGDEEAVAFELVDVASQEDDADEVASSEIDLEAALEYFEGATASTDAIGTVDGDDAADPNDALGDDNPVEESAFDAPGSEGERAAAEADSVARETGPEQRAEVDAAVAGPSPWETEDTDDAFLLAPPSEDEIRALRGNPLQRFARPLAGAVAAIVIGGVGLSLFSSDEAPPTSASKRPATMLPREVPSAPPPLVDYARRDEAGDDVRAIFAPAAGFVRPEATRDPEPASLADAQPAARVAPEDAVAIASPPPREREVLDLTPSEAAAPRAFAAIAESDTSDAVPDSPSREVRATPESGAARNQAGHATPAAPSPLADDDR